MVDLLLLVLVSIIRFLVVVHMAVIVDVKSISQHFRSCVVLAFFHDLYFLLNATERAQITSCSHAGCESQAPLRAHLHVDLPIPVVLLVLFEEDGVALEGPLDDAFVLQLLHLGLPQVLLLGRYLQLAV